VHLTSEQITRKTFVIRGQGYDRDEVAAFLRLVAEQVPGAADENGVQRTSIEEAQRVETERIREEAETYARHVREAADAYAREVRRKADDAAASRWDNRGVAAVAGSTASVVPISPGIAEPPSFSESTRSTETIDRDLRVPSPVTVDPVAASAASGGLPSSGLASLDSVVDDVMAGVRADIRVGSATSEQATGLEYRSGETDDLRHTPRSAS